MPLWKTWKHSLLNGGLNTSHEQTPTRPKPTIFNQIGKKWTPKVWNSISCAASFYLLWRDVRTFREIIWKCFRISARQFVFHFVRGKNRKRKSKPVEMFAFNSSKRNHLADVSRMEKCRKFLIPHERFPFFPWISLLSKFNSNFFYIFLRSIHQSIHSFIPLLIRPFIHISIHQSIYCRPSIIRRIPPSSDQSMLNQPVGIQSIQTSSFLSIYLVKLTQ